MPLNREILEVYASNKRTRKYEKHLKQQGQLPQDIEFKEYHNITTLLHYTFVPIENSKFQVRTIHFRDNLDFTQSH